MITFDKPQLLIGFAGFIPLAIFAAVHYLKCRPFLGFFLEKKSRARELNLRYLFSDVFFGIFLACAVLAAAGPRWGRQMTTEYRRGLDVTLALDLSRSMDVRDVPVEEETPPAPARSRLDRAIQVALETVSASEGIRFGAAVGKGRAILAVPLTYDIETAVQFLEGLSSSAVTGGGTNLETLLDAASSAFLEAFPTRRGIILFSDGEAWTGSLAAALDRIMEAGIAVIALGFGTETGGYVPSLSAEPETSISYRRTEVLRNIAERTGGIYVDGNLKDASKLVTDRLRSLSAESETKGYRLEDRHRWRLFVIAGLTSLGLSKLLEKRRRVSA
ncbi:MAG: VWA domain-containing protein [Spirochaetaceae bacterium]|nr:VWA domain-containing protein [Spirochaetaceae bacterium]